MTNRITQIVSPVESGHETWRGGSSVSNGGRSRQRDREIETELERDRETERYEAEVMRQCKSLE